MCKKKSRLHSKKRAASRGGGRRQTKVVPAQPAQPAGPSEKDASSDSEGSDLHDLHDPRTGRWLRAGG